MNTEMNSWLSKNPLAKYRAKIGVSRDILGKQLKVTGDAIYMWETGRRVPGGLHMLKLSRMLPTGSINKWLSWLESKPDTGEK